MELRDVIRKRRSIRKFDSSKDVTNEQIEAILNAANLAPTSGNTQCPRYIIVRDQELKDKLSTDAGHQPFIREVPVVIVVCADLEINSKYGERGVNTYSLQDTAAAIQNMLLTITDLGLATCWVGAFDEDGAKKVLDLKPGLRPVAMLPIGHALEEPSMPKRNDINKITDWK